MGWNVKIEARRVCTICEHCLLICYSTKRKWHKCIYPLVKILTQHFLFVFHSFGIHRLRVLENIRIHVPWTFSFPIFLRRSFFLRSLLFFILNYWHKMASLFIRSGCKSFYSSQRYLLSISFLLFLCFLVVFFSSTIPFGSSCSMEIERERESTHKKKYQEICYAWERDVI